MVASPGLNRGNELCCTQGQMDDGASASNQVSRLPISKETAGGKVLSTWDYNMPLCWLIRPTIHRSRLNRCRAQVTAWRRWQWLTGEGHRLYCRRRRY